MSFSALSVAISPFGFANQILVICRDVAAGVAILLEAGGLVTTANPPRDPDTAKIEDVRLGSRLYLAIRFSPHSDIVQRIY